MPEADTPIGSLTGAPGNIGGAARRGRSAITRSRTSSQVKALGTYTIPKIDVQLGDDVPERAGAAAQAATRRRRGWGRRCGRRSAARCGRRQHDRREPGIAGHPLRGPAVSDRLPGGQDLPVRHGNRRLTASVDLFNLFNGNAVLTQSNTYSITNTQSWGTPTTVQQPRLLKFTATLNF